MAQASLIYDDHGRPRRMIGSHIDITDRKLIEIEREQILNQMHDKAEQLSQVMRSVPEGVVVLDSGRRVLLANPQAESLLTLLATYTGERQLLELGDVALAGTLAAPQGQVLEVVIHAQISGTKCGAVTTEGATSSRAKHCTRNFMRGWRLSRVRHGMQHVPSSSINVQAMCASSSNASVSSHSVRNPCALSHSHSMG